VWGGDDVNLGGGSVLELRKRWRDGVELRERRSDSLELGEKIEERWLDLEERRVKKERRMASSNLIIGGEMKKKPRNESVTCGLGRTWGGCSACVREDLNLIQIWWKNRLVQPKTRKSLSRSLGIVWI
jgi:hypothetical protein